MITALILAVFALGPGQAAAAPSAEATAGVEVTYLGNEGFLWQAGERKVLVDALVGRSLSQYVDQDADLRARLERAEPPFDDVDLVLATHVHADHFGAESVGRHLSANPRAVFVSTAQAVAALERQFEGFDAIRARVHIAAPTPDEPTRFPDLHLTVLALHHGETRRPPIENNGYVVELGGQKLLHIGDTETTAEQLAAQDVAGLAIDVAFVPSWYFTESPWKGAIEAAVRPARTVVMHLAPRWKSESATSNQRESRARVPRIRREHPEAVIFEAPLQRMHFEKR